MTGWKHDALALDLAGYLAGPELMVWTDMQLGPSGSPRPDVYTLRKSYSKPHPLAFECKISRSDLRSDTTSGKWQRYLKYAGAVVFAVPDGLATVADIPVGCGLIVRKAKEWRYARRPTLQKVTPPFDACMKLLIDGVRRTYAEAPPQPRKADLWREHEAVRKRYGAAVALAARDLAEAQRRLDAITAERDARWDVEKSTIEMRARDLHERFERERADMEGARRDVLEWLGLSETATPFTVQRRIAELKADCDADAKVQAANDRLARARRSVEAALTSLPMPEPVAAIGGGQ